CAIDPVQHEINDDQIKTLVHRDGMCFSLHELNMRESGCSIVPCVSRGFDRNANRTIMRRDSSNPKTVRRTNLENALGMQMIQIDKLERDISVRVIVVQSRVIPLEPTISFKCSKNFILGHVHS